MWFGINRQMSFIVSRLSLVCVYYCYSINDVKYNSLIHLIIFAALDFFLQQSLERIPSVTRGLSVFLFDTFLSKVLSLNIENIELIWSRERFWILSEAYKGLQRSQKKIENHTEGRGNGVKPCRSESFLDSNFPLTTIPMTS